MTQKEVDEMYGGKWVVNIVEAFLFGAIFMVVDHFSDSFARSIGYWDTSLLWKMGAPFLVLSRIIHYYQTKQTITGILEREKQEENNALLERVATLEREVEENKKDR